MREEKEESHGILLQESSIWKTPKRKKRRERMTAFSTLSRQSLLISVARLAEDIARSKTERVKEDHINSALIALESQLQTAIDYIHESNNMWLKERFDRLNSITTERALKLTFRDIANGRGLQNYESTSDIMKRIQDIEWTSKLLPRKSDTVKYLLKSLCNEKNLDDRKQNVLHTILVSLNHLGMKHMVLRCRLNNFSYECRKVIIRVLRKHVVEPELLNVYDAYTLSNNNAVNEILKKSDRELVLIVRKYQIRGMALDVKELLRRKSHHEDGNNMKGNNNISEITTEEFLLSDPTVGRDFAVSLLCECVNFKSTHSSKQSVPIISSSSSSSKAIESPPGIASQTTTKKHSTIRRKTSAEVYADQMDQRYLDGITMWRDVMKTLRFENCNVNESAFGMILARLVNIETAMMLNGSGKRENHLRVRKMSISLDIEPKHVSLADDDKSCRHILVVLDWIILNQSRLRLYSEYFKKPINFKNISSAGTNLKDLLRKVNWSHPQTADRTLQAFRCHHLEDLSTIGDTITDMKSLCELLRKTSSPSSSSNSGTTVRCHPTGDLDMCGTSVVDRKQLLNLIHRDLSSSDHKLHLSKFHTTAGVKFYSHVQEHLAFASNLKAMEKIITDLRGYWDAEHTNSEDAFLFYKNVSENISKSLINSSTNIFIEDIHKFLPRDIEVTIKVNSITDVEVKKYTYTIDFTMMLDWTDCTLGDRYEGDGGPPIDFTDHFMPCIEIVNISTHTFEENPMVIGGKQLPRLKGSHNRVTLTQKYRARLRTRMDLRRFPFDNQLLLIRLNIKSLMCGVDRVYVDMSQPRKFRKNHTLDSEWDWLTSWSISRDKMNDDPTNLIKKGNIDQNFLVFVMQNWNRNPQVVQEIYHNVTDMFFNHLAVHMVVKRDAIGTLWNICFPYLCIELAALTAYTAEFQDLEVRFGTNATMLLSLLAFKWMLMDVLPGVSYLTVMDKFVVLGFVTLMFQAGSFCIVAILDRNPEYETLAEVIDKVSLSLMISLIMLGIAILAWYSTHRVMPKYIFEKGDDFEDTIQNDWKIRSKERGVVRGKDSSYIVGTLAR